LVGAAENDLFDIFGGLSLFGETGEPDITWVKPRGFVPKRIELAD
jgi:hypothetical protein